ncbi:DUF2087 domain-containing protein [Paenibacillus aquistagni]|uniref:DUF2087 domain-containing protein n=1 Tax=Paenibacillus aquistagni TaxID=1852522 RepID=UPI000B50E6DC|nr:DUF2087 domain-containing protein [Paenibacillus aquistagni]
MKIDVSDYFQRATIEELKQGHLYDPKTEQHVCLICGQCYEEGVIYTDGEPTAFYEAKKKVKLHIQAEHESMFHYLIGLDKKRTGLSDVQKELLLRFYNGVSDSDIVKELGGSASTIRNHRFTMREKLKQAKLFIALMELVEAKNDEAPKLVAIPQHAARVDERYAVTEEEKTKILQQYFKEGLNGPIESFPKKEKRKLVILQALLNRFDRGQTYTEKQINEILMTAYPDYVTLRRYLIEYGFLDRKDDGSEYWLK